MTEKLWFEKRLNFYGGANVNSKKFTKDFIENMTSIIISNHDTDVVFWCVNTFTENSAGEDVWEVHEFDRCAQHSSTLYGKNPQYIVNLLNGVNRLAPVKSNSVMCFIDNSLIYASSDFGGEYVPREDVDDYKKELILARY